MRLRLIGDVHQQYEHYLPLLQGADYTLQVGDLGFDYSPLADLDFGRHSAIAGNHDNYEPGPNHFKNHPIFLGDFGLHEIPGFGKSIFYVRGAWSICNNKTKEPLGCHFDRKGKKVWSPDEELSEQNLEQAIDLYRVTKPDFVVTHEAPFSIVGELTNPGFAKALGYETNSIKSKTNLALQTMLDFHQPKLWVFGHYHDFWRKSIGRTQFICLDMVRDRSASQNIKYSCTDILF